MRAATREELLMMLQGYSFAPKEWVEVMVSARLSLQSASAMMESMVADNSSPLREAEANVLSEDVLALVAARKKEGSEFGFVKRRTVVVKAVLSASEQAGVRAVVGHLVSLSFRTGKRFGHTGHAVARAVRQATNAYLYLGIPAGTRVTEVGANVTGWMYADMVGYDYYGTVPKIGPRDVVRMSWKQVAKYASVNLSGFYSEKVVARAEQLLRDYASVFADVRIEDLARKTEYIVSNDANYDIRFDHMPVIMAMKGARIWKGVMTRARHLSRVVKQTNGAVPVLDARYQVDWEKDRVDFHFAKCPAFGYSHRVSEYVKYEENNYYMWETNYAHYVYSKSPETNDSLLFFSVVRVSKGNYTFVEPCYSRATEFPTVKVKTVWAVGDEVDGVPTSFQPVELGVDELALSKVIEKRRALDHKGNFSMTLVLVRSTGVRFWVNGVPVGIESRLHVAAAEGLAVAVEALASKYRLESNLVFEEGMRAFVRTSATQGWAVNFLTAMFDSRGALGKIKSSMVRSWEALRSRLSAVALSDLKDFDVVVERIPQYVRVGDPSGGALELPEDVTGFDCESDCLCAEIADVRTVLKMGSLHAAERDEMEQYLSALLQRKCDVCNTSYDIDSGFGSDSTSSCGDDGAASGSSCGSDRSEVIVRGKKPGGMPGRSPEEDFFPGPGSAGDGREEGVEYEITSTMVKEMSMSPSEVTRTTLVEYVELTRHLAKALLSEVKVDAARVYQMGYTTTRDLLRYSTSRTKHSMVKVVSGRITEVRGHKFESIGAVFDYRGSRLIPVKSREVGKFVNADDGWYYTSSHLKVFNGVQMANAVEEVLDTCDMGFDFSKVMYVVGVPGAGKTYTMMKKVAVLYKAGVWPVLVLSETRASARQAEAYGVKFGIPEHEIEGKCLTFDSYLLNKRTKCDFVFVDEFPMAHMGKVKASVVVAGAKHSVWYGDGQQIEYDSFQREFPTPFANFDPTVVPSRALRTMDETHRLAEDVCAMWLDRYPRIYPCECCDRDIRPTQTVKVRKVPGLGSVVKRPEVRYATFTQDEKEQLHGYLGFSCSLDAARELRPGGLATVHEDQGTTHQSVSLVRNVALFDRKPTLRNPSLYNRIPYVLTASTRHVEEFVYSTVSLERDEMMKRAVFASDRKRLELVRKKKGFGDA